VSDRIDHLIRRISDDPDKLHSDRTPAAAALEEIGLPALGQVLDLMRSSDPMTRLRAQRVVEGITMRHLGFRPGHGWDASENAQAWRRLWKEQGDLDWQAPDAAREESVAMWKRWLSGLASQSDTSSSEP